MSAEVYATLGPEGTNHDLVLQTYLDARDSDAQIRLFTDLDSVLAACAEGEATHLLICAAHQDAARIVSEAQYNHNILLTDSFIAESQPLAILTRKAYRPPRTIAVHPATKTYADLSQFEIIHEVSSTVAAFEGLCDGKWDSALTAARFAQDADVRITAQIPPPRDAWLVLSREKGGATGDILSI